MLSAHETAAIVKFSKRVIKVKYDFVALEDETLAKVVQLPQSLMKTQHLFRRSKLKSYSNRTCTNTCTLRAVDAQSISGDLKHELEVKEITLELQRVRNVDTVKVGRIFGMIDNIGTREWLD